MRRSYKISTHILPAGQRNLTLQTVVCCDLLHHIRVLLFLEAICPIRVKQVVSDAVTGIRMKFDLESRKICQ